ncbi:MAG TPA: hypothetical protein VJY33_25160, partial [Isosphaeraceae bacterium]|nr:hypothetical protein [Isosphaeraceae bacterium]
MALLKSTWSNKAAAVTRGTPPSPGGAGRTLRTDLGRPAVEKVGLLAGSGRFPILFAEAAQRQGLKVAC